MPFRANRFLPRLEAAAQRREVGHTERVLAVARVVLVLAALGALALDPVEPVHFAPAAYLLTGLYLLYALLTLAWMNFHPRPSRAFQVGLQAVDIFWPALLSVFTWDLGGVFFLFYLFVLLEAAYRWGLRETLATALAMATLVLAQGFLPLRGAVPPPFLSDASPWALFMMRGPYLLILGYLAGYMGEREKVPRWMAMVRGRALAEVQAQTSLRGAMQVMLGTACKLAGAGRAMVVAEEVGTRRAFLWDAKPATQGDAGLKVTSYELDAAQKECYRFEPPGHAWHVICPKEPCDPAGSLDLLALDEEGERLRGSSWTLPQALLAAHPFRSLLGLTTSYGSSWSGQVLLFDPDLGSGRRLALQFFQELVRRASPVVYGIFVARRLRSRAGAVERARVARELHDGVIQSLIALEMQMDVLRRRPEVQGTDWGRELGDIQLLLRVEVLSLRELMQQMRPLDLGPKQLLEFLAFTVDKFRRETSIAASFVSPLEEVHLPSSVCSEVARIVQEALANIRKHSQARHVVVRLEATDGAWRLVVDDDGRGFDFSGRLTHAELDAARKGPLVIKERVRSIGGELTVESLPGRGARLEITLPHKTHEQ